MNNILGGILAVLAAVFIWMNWPSSQDTAQGTKAALAAEVPTPVAETAVPTVAATVVASNIAVDEQGNLLYLNSEWESVRANPQTATGTVKVPANRVVWGDRLVFKDCEGNPHDLKMPSIMALPCETQVTVTWGAFALEPEVTVDLAKPYLDNKYRKKAGFPTKDGFVVFPKEGAVKSAP
jgi:hypothetical protein